jgi:hypothetical protein
MARSIRQLSGGSGVDKVSGLGTLEVARRPRDPHLPGVDLVVDDDRLSHLLLSLDDA